MSVREAAAQSLPWPDMYFTPAYGAACEASDNAEWEIAVWPEGPILFPYLKRPIDPSLGCGENLFDVISPYGHCGTYGPAGLPAEQWKSFRTTLRAELRERGAVAEFQRMSGLVPGREAMLAADPGLQAMHLTDTVLINVTRGYDVCWAEAEGRSRKATRKARRLGYTWAIRNATEADIAPGSALRTLYEATMRRAEASPYYYFPTLYYERLLEGFGELCYVPELRSPKGDVVVAGLFIGWKPFLHGIVLGSDREAGRDGAGNMMYDELIHWAADTEGIDYVQLGGGIRPNDSLYMFKRGFGGERVQFWIAKSILCDETYRSLVHARAEATGRTADELLASSYFPAYRA